MPIAGVRSCVDGGLFLIVIVSLIIRRPFTLQYAREQVEPDLWKNPEFVRANYVITAAWAAAFAGMVAVDLTFLYDHRLPALAGIITTIIALSSASRFTSWYPGYRKRLLTKRGK